MYAIIETGGKQYKVAKDDIIHIETLDAKVGGEITIDKVLLTQSGTEILVGTPYLKGANVVCEVLTPMRNDKVWAFKYKKRKSEKKKIGHRQNLLKVKVKSIELAKG